MHIVFLILLAIAFVRRPRATIKRQIRRQFWRLF